MISILRSGLVTAIMLVAFHSNYAQQSQLSTNPPLNGGNGSGGVTFNLETNQAIVVDSLWGLFYNAGTVAWEVWYNPTAVSGPPTINVANGWTQVGSGSLTATSTATTGNDIQPIPLDVNVQMPAGSTYGWYIGHSTSNGCAYSTWNATNQETFTDGVITIYTGNNIGYGGNIPNPTFHPRQYNGRVVYSQAIINMFPYCENFDADDGEWSVSGVLPSWEHGDPNNTIINTAFSEDSAWVTDLDGTYNNDELSYLLSPLMDLSSLNDPYVKFYKINDLENGEDGVQFQVSSDSGTTFSVVGSSSSGNWYNSGTIAALASNGNGNGWTGTSNQWESVSHSLLANANDTAVVVRLLCATDGNVTSEGFGIDDFIIAESNDISLVELIYDDSICGQSSTPIEAVLCNRSIDEKFGFGVDIDTNGVTVSYAYPDTLPVCACDTVTILDFNSEQGGIWQMEAVVTNSGDVNSLNDTLTGSLTAFAAPEVSFSGGGSFCEGDTSEVTFIFTGQSSWSMTYNDGSGNNTFGNIVNDTLVIEVTESSNFTVLSISDATGCPADTSQITSEAIFDFSPAPPLDLGPDGFRCEGELIDAGPGMDSYTWNQGGTNQTFAVVASGVLAVTITDSVGCQSEDEVDITMKDKPIVIISDVSLCEGKKYTFDVGTGFLGYLWHDGSTGQSFEVDTIQTVSITVTAINGCTDSDSAQVTAINPNPEPTLTSTTGSAPVTLDAGSGYSFYQWNTFETTQTIQVSIAGTYSCTVTDGNGCKGKGTVEADITTSIGSIDGNESFRVFPNPTKSSVSISLDDSFDRGEIRVELIDIAGRVVGEWIKNEAEFNLPLGVDPGKYILIVQTESEIREQQIMVIK